MIDRTSLVGRLYSTKSLAEHTQNILNGSNRVNVRHVMKNCLKLCGARHMMVACSTAAVHFTAYAVPLHTQSLLKFHLDIECLR
jgi:hypothetical protein